MSSNTPVKQVIEAALFAAGEALSIDRLLGLFDEELQPSRDQVRQVLQALEQEYADHAIELRRVGSGYRFQVRREYAAWVGKLWAQRPTRYSRALLETLAIIAYRQPITRAEIEAIRGVSVSSTMMKTLLDREWIRVVGHRDLPGKPAVYGSTRHFLDYFNLASLNDLPPLAELQDIADITPQLDLPELPEQQDAPDDAPVDDSGSADPGQAVPESPIARVPVDEGGADAPEN